MSLKAVMTRAQTAVCTAVSPMSGSPTFDIDKKKQKRGEFKTPPRPTGRRSNYQATSAQPKDHWRDVMNFA